jgi:serine phosphatase RsbU (regulator of sigma subunit)
VNHAGDGAAVDALTRELRNFQDIAQHLIAGDHELPQVPGFDICGMSLPLHGVVGGDHLIYLDFNRRFDIDARIRRAERQGRVELGTNLKACRNTAGILILDVSGHHVTDALLAAMLHQAFLLGALYELDATGRITRKLFENLNTRFYNSSGPDKFITMIYGEMLEGARFRFISAGHPVPLVFSREHDRLMPLDTSTYVSCPPLGLMPSFDDIDRGETNNVRFKEKYETNEWALMGDGDMLLLYTDGLLENAEDANALAVEGLLRDLKHLPARVIVDRLAEYVRGRGPQGDDVTFVLIKRV